MEKSEEIFKIKVNYGASDKPILVQPEQTTDGVPIYHCYCDGISIGELRQEASGEWVQLWGDLSAHSLQQVGEAIASHLASTR